MCKRIPPRFNRPILQVAHDRRQELAAGLVGKHNRFTALYGRSKRIRGAEINADSKAMLMRRSRKSRLSDLKEGHVFYLFLCGRRRAPGDFFRCVRLGQANK